MFANNKGSSSQSDRISNLPSSLIEKILVHLPIEDAAKTSILSSKWRYKWTTIPDLIFDDQDLSISSLKRGPESAAHKLANIVNDVLFQHSGPVRTFMLYTINTKKSYVHLDVITKWISYLSRNGIKKLLVHFGRCTPYCHLPSSLYHCESLEYLSLSCCSLKPSLVVNRLPKLKALFLSYCTLVMDGFELFLSGLPLLETLVLTSIDGFSRLTVDSPKLKCCVVHGHFESLYLKNTRGLAKLAVLPSVTLKHMKCFHPFISLSVLMIRGNLLKFLLTEDVPEARSTNLTRLSQLEISSLSFEDLPMISGALCMIRNSPNLQELMVKVQAVKVDGLPSIEEILKAEGAASYHFERLKIIQITSVFGTTPEMEFMKFLLANSPTLEKMIVKSINQDPSNENTRMLKEFLRFYPTTSSRAELVFLGQQENEHQQSGSFKFFKRIDDMICE